MSENKIKESEALLKASASKKIEGMLDSSQDSISSDVDPQSSMQSLSDLEENESESLSSIHLSPQKAALVQTKKKVQTNEDEPPKVQKRPRRRRHRRSLAEIISEISTETESDSSEQVVGKHKKKQEKTFQKKEKSVKQDNKEDLEIAIKSTTQEKDLGQAFTVKEEEESDEDSCNENQLTQQKSIQNDKKQFPNKQTNLQTTLENFRQNQSLTIEEMETMSKLLSIQANELQMKQKNKKHSHKLNQQQQQRPPSFKALLGELPMKKVKQEIEVETQNKSQIVKKNINALIGQLQPKEDAYAGVNMENRQFKVKKQIQQQEQQQYLQKYSGVNNQYQTNGIGYHQRQNVGFSGITEKITQNCSSQGYLKEASGVQGNSVFGMRNHTGNITPTIRGNILGNRFEQQRQQLNSVADIETEIQSRIVSIKQEIAPLLAYLDSGLLSGATSFAQSFEERQFNYNNKEDEDMNYNTSNTQIDSSFNSRIYEEIREKRAQLQLQDQQYQEQQLQCLKQQIQLKLSQQQQLEQQQQQFQQEFQLQQQENIQLRNSQNRQARILTSTIPATQTRQIEKGQAVMNFDSKRGQRQPSRDNNNSHGHQQTGRNYDARAGDWLCGNCRNFNFAYREICNRCGIKQDENVLMVHPQITKEALDLIHELNNGMKKQQQRRADEIKRTYEKPGQQNKENFRNFQNAPKNNNGSDNSCEQQNRLNEQIIGKIFPTTQRQFQQQRQCVSPPQQQEQKYGLLEDLQSPMNLQQSGLSYEQLDAQNRVFTQIKQQSQNNGIMQAIKPTNQQANSIQLAKKKWSVYPRIDMR